MPGQFGASSEELQIVRWTADGAPVIVECPADVLDDIRIQAVDAFHMLSRGGVEVGGVLYGAVEEGAPATVRVSAFRPLECEHLSGPSFVLSRRDQEGLLRMLGDRELSRQCLVPVGWYHSHTRGDTTLRETDLTIYNRYFPEAWQIALVLRPEKMLPARCAVFFRMPDGSIRPDAPLAELELNPIARRARLAAARSSEAPAVESEWNGAPVSVEAEPGLAPVEEPGRRKPEAARLSWKWVAVILFLAAASVAFVARAYWHTGDTSLSLRALDYAGQLRIDWNFRAQGIRDGEGAILDITDGEEQTSIALERADLLQGSVTYARKTGRIVARIRLRQPDGATLEEITRFIGPPPVGSPGTVADSAPLGGRQPEQVAAGEPAASGATEPAASGKPSSQSKVQPKPARRRARR
jgi:proteasome lid subunit RPN8/RPN11